MAAQQGSTQAHDLKFTYDIPDLQKSLNHIYYNPGSIMGMLNENKDFSKFSYLVKLAQLDTRLSKLLCNLTVFVPSDAYIEGKYNDNVFINMDKYTAREIVLYHCLNKKINYASLISSDGLYLDTEIDPSSNAKILCQNYGSGVVLNNKAQIVKPDVMLNNGMIHIINDLMIPPMFSDNLRPYFSC